MSILTEIQADAINIFDQIRRLAGVSWQGLFVSPLTAAEAGLGVIIVVIAFLAIFPVIRMARGRNASAPSTSLGKLTGGPKILGVMAAVSFFLVFGGWALYAPLSSAALAPGVVSPDGSRKTVQHLEGGIIRTINVREGDHVEAGQTLLTLESIRAQARYEELREQLIYQLAIKARLLSEEQELTELSFDFPADLISEATEQVETATRGQIALFKNRLETQAARERILAKRINQLQEEIIGLKEVISAQDDQLSLLSQELESSQSLYDQGLQRLSPLLALKRQEADLRAERASNRAAIARLGQQIGETELQLFATQQQNREQVSDELSSVLSQLATIRSQLPERADALARTVVVAPISGQVLNILVTTESGGVVRPGGDILDIVPEDGELVIDAQVRPQDIETIYPGMQARVLLTAYTQRNLPQIFGTLRSVSADRLVDDRTGEPYFLAKVLVSAEEIEQLGGNVGLIAGMPADVMILTGERTFFDFLIKPFADSIRASFREE